MVSSFIGQMLSNAIKKPSYLFTILTITFGFNLYLVKFHGFTILELQDNFTKIRYIEFLYIIIAYSFSQTFLVHLYYLLEAIISDLKAPSYIDKDPSRPTISYHGLKRIALYQSNYAAYRMYKDEKNKIQEYDNRLVASFFFLLSAILDTIISLSQSIIASIYNSPYQHLIGIALGLVVINAIATIKDFDQKESMLNSSEVSLFDIKENVGRILFEDMYNRYEQHRKKERQIFYESHCPIYDPSSDKD